MCVCLYITTDLILQRDISFEKQTNFLTISNCCVSPSYSTYYQTVHKS